MHPLSQVLPASDVWAAGVMAYHLLSARFPFGQYMLLWDTQL
jgi:serine/threonine protein kinase